MKYDTKHQIQKEKAIAYLYKLLSKDCVVEVKKVNISRTIQQNKYLHVLISLFSIEFGYTLEEGKTLLKRNCSFIIYEKKGVKFLRKTSEMKTDELTKFIEWIRTYSVNKGLYLLSADEYKQNRIYIDNEIKRNEEFL